MVVVLFTKLLNSGQSEMLLKRAAAALILRYHNLYIVLNQHANCREVDFPKHRFHQAPCQQRNTRTSWAVLLHQPASIRGGRFHN